MSIKGNFLNNIVKMIFMQNILQNFQQNKIEQLDIIVSSNSRLLLDCNELKSFTLYCLSFGKPFFPTQFVKFVSLQLPRAWYPDPGKQKEKKLKINCILNV